MSTPAYNIGQPFNPHRIFVGVFIPEALVRYAGLSATSKLAYGRLARYAGKDGRCYPAVSTLAAEIGVKKRRAQDCLNELETAGFIRREYQAGKPTEYIFLWHAVFSGEQPMQDTAPVQNTAHPPMQETARVCDRCSARTVHERLQVGRSGGAHESDGGRQTGPGSGVSGVPLAVRRVRVALIAYSWILNRMPLFHVSPTRLVNTDEIAEIEYTPARDYTAGSDGAGFYPFHDASVLHIRIKCVKEGVRLEEAEADEAWRNFQTALYGPVKLPSAE